VIVIVGSVFIYRFFCRVLCPLGALYGLFNKFAFFGIKLDRPKCVDCGKCISKCKMDIKEVGDHECINCGECISVCPTKAIEWRGGKIILPDNEIPEDATDEEKAAIEKRRKKRTAALKIVAAVLSLSLLGGALYYYNFVDEIPSSNIIPGTDDEDDGIPVGNRVNQKCPTIPLSYVNGYGNGTLDIKSLRGKVVVINFWGTWCDSCKEELPHFSEVAGEYSTDDVIFVTVHTSGTRGAEIPEEYIASKDYLHSSNMLFVMDKQLEGSQADEYYTALGGRGSYPMTLVLDERGVITAKKVGKMDYTELKSAVEAALAG
jgi:thiol-disulfide isomerase/thioredoxin/Fe-S-cluster-containing hydrogenase component 2